MPRALSTNSDLSETKAFEMLQFGNVTPLVSERELQRIYPRKKIPDAVFGVKPQNFAVAVEVKRVSNRLRRDTLIHAIEKLALNPKLVTDFRIKAYHIVLQTRSLGKNDNVIQIVRDAHAIMQGKELGKHVSGIPYKLGYNGPLIHIHIQKVGQDCFENIGYENVNPNVLVKATEASCSEC